MSMIPLRQASQSPAITRLASLTPLSAEDVAALQDAECHARRLPPRREIISERQLLPQPSILLWGWACRTHTLSDGRRQIISLILPGDLIGLSWHSGAVATYSVVSLTEITVCPAPPVSFNAFDAKSGLAEAFALSKAWDDAYLLRHVTRLGRLTAYERLADFMLETFERLKAAGLVNGNSFQMPLTQETLADALGLTSVHVSRTLQALRQDGVLSVDARTVNFPDFATLAGTQFRSPVCVQSQ